MKSSTRVILFIVFLFYSNITLKSDVLNVPSPLYPTIQSAIDSTSIGDTVLVAPGTYYENIIINAKYIVLSSEFMFSNDTSDISNTIIDGARNGTVLKIVNVRDSSLTLIGLTLSNGNATGGIELNESTAIIQHTRIINNEVFIPGGGIRCRKSDLFLDNVLIANNKCISGPAEGFPSGGGLFIIDYSYVTALNTIIESNYAHGGGGGLYINTSTVNLQNVDIKHNISNYGGGLFIGGGDSTKVYMDNVRINNNMCDGSGGGIYCDEADMSVHLADVSIFNNKIKRHTGGGIFCESPLSLSFSEEKPSSIYFNKAHEGGADIAMATDEFEFEAVLDSFTVSEPGPFHLYPLEKFNLTVQNPLFESVDAHLFVSADGSDDNSGTSPSDALRSINKAILCTSTNSSKQRYIHVAPGLYSESLTGEDLPLYGRNYLSVIGDKEETTLIDGEDKYQLWQFSRIRNFKIKNITLQNGNDPGGGGIYSAGGHLIDLENLIIRNNHSGNSGAISLKVAYPPNHYRLKNVLIYGNSSISNSKISAGMYIYGLDADLINVTIVDNSYNASSDNIGGLCILGGAEVNVVNSLIRGNGEKSILCKWGFNSYPTVAIGWSNIEFGEDGVVKDGTTTINWLEGNIDEDPLFVGGDPFDYHLQPESPCIDAGTALFEFDGDTIINLLPEEYIGLAPDMGAFGIDPVNFIRREILTPSQFKLYQNFPNPFNSQTTISYQLPKAGQVNLSIYNISGQLIEVLENERKPANNYKVRWDASGYASGIYFVRLSAGEYIAIHKMLLVK